jgi:hypothetical protein
MSKRIKGKRPHFMKNTKKTLLYEKTITYSMKKILYEKNILSENNVLFYLR